MKTARALGGLVLPLLLGCTGPAPAAAGAPPRGKEQPPVPVPPKATVSIAETTVGQIAGCRVGVSNIWAEDFADETGKRRKAPRATLTGFGCPAPHKDFELRVHEGQKIEIAGQKYVVSKVHATPDNRGAVVLTPDQKRG